MQLLHVSGLKYLNFMKVLLRYVFIASPNCLFFMLCSILLHDCPFLNAKGLLPADFQIRGIRIRVTAYQKSWLMLRCIRLESY